MFVADVFSCALRSLQFVVKVDSAQVEIPGPFLNKFRLKWAHVAITVDEDFRVSVFVNGDLVGFDVLPPVTASSDDGCLVIGESSGAFCDWSGDR